MRAPKSFEDGMARLETILSQMQSEETTLSESVKLYAEAASLMEYCHAALEKSSSSVPFAEDSPSEELPHPVTVPTSSAPAINVQISFLFIFLSSIIYYF